MKQILFGCACAVILVLYLGSFGRARAGDAEALFEKGVAAYRTGDFTQSVASFQALADKGIRNGKLYYNLGNACLKQGRLGYALLWYERALRLMPDDPDLNFNYAYALSLTRDERSPSGASLLKILFFWKYYLTARELQWLSITFNALFWLVLILRQVLPKPRGGLSALTTGMLVLAVVSTTTVVYNTYDDAYVKEGVILDDEAPVRSGLTDRATELFLLHAGAKVTIEREKSGYYRIRYSDGKIGWIESAKVGRI